MHAHLIAVQASLRPERYRDAAAYRAWILELAERAVEGLDDGTGGEDAPRLIAFPEMIGLPLPLLLDAGPPAPGLARAAARLARAEAARLPRAMIRWRTGPLHALLALRAPDAWRAHLDAFRAAARAARATIVAGTLLGPDVEDEPARGPHVVDARPANLALTLSPTGAVIGRTPKRFLTAGAESRLGLRRARPEEIAPIATPLGPVGVAVCLDGFHASVVERLDALGARVLVQPSANPAPWDRPWPPDPALEEGEAWLRFGLAERVRGRACVRWGVNPMLVGGALGLEFRGRSSIVADPRRAASPPGLPPGVLALAPSADEEAIVRLRVALDGSAAGDAPGSGGEAGLAEGEGRREEIGIRPGASRYRMRP